MFAAGGTRSPDAQPSGVRRNGLGRTAQIATRAQICTDAPNVHGLEPCFLSPRPLASLRSQALRLRCLLLRFRTADLVLSGAVTAATTRLVLTARTKGRTIGDWQDRGAHHSVGRNRRRRNRARVAFRASYPRICRSRCKEAAMPWSWVRVPTGTSPALSDCVAPKGATRQAYAECIGEIITGLRGSGSGRCEVRGERQVGTRPLLVGETRGQAQDHVCSRCLGRDRLAYGR